MYNPDLGTFDQRDPIENEGGNNLYEYVGDSPSCEQTRAVNNLYLVRLIHQSRPILKGSVAVT